MQKKQAAAILLAMTFLTMAEARFLSSETTTTSTTQEPPKETASSHLLFYLTVEKELVPQTKDLAARARHILQIKCSEFYNKTSDCILDTDKLPQIPALGDFPSDGALRREGSRMFSKHLLKSVHVTLLKLQILLEEENEGIEPLTQLIHHMERTRRQLHDQMDLFYKVDLREKGSFINLNKSKKRYMNRSRLGDDGCRRDNDDNDDDDDACLTEDDYRLRLLYTAYRQLLRVHHVLGYTVRLSWLFLEADSWP